MSANNRIEEKNRNQMLKELQSIPFWAYLTALTSEWCLEVQTYTSEGYRCEWKSMDDNWDIYRLEIIPSEKWKIITDKCRKNGLKIDDLEETNLFNLAKCIGVNDWNQKSLSELFRDLGTWEIPPKKAFFCYYDVHNNSVHFFESELELTEHLSDTPVDCKWVEMSDEELRHYLKLYEEEGPAIPCASFD